ncbi:MAG: 16S rRNA (cytidine(1402)-2'-O)-methyltransferase [Acidobacteria bacterium]|nr:MAG: 16S rRNA (cytidine(1402)-2'-O)-methyltransferase [Acidobacteriota bacterium]PYQ22249.1 MAG: 16S rRNA (cytidine(1402)-2'-O)-methyltransferase [Acidobacteriota bacterium]
MTGTPGTLYVVATPIGNLEDVTRRALRVLREVDLIACEDTRRTARLLEAHGISTSTTSYFEHNERWKGARILDRVREGSDVALVSDAGTPAISDPGFRLVREAREQGLRVVPVPGPSAAMAALSVAGLPTDRFLFVGFLPSRAGPRRAALQELASRKETLVFYESPVRAVACVADMREILGERPAFLGREITKLHEEYRSGTLSELRSSLAERKEIRGEIVLVVGAAGAHPAPSLETAEDLFARLTAEGHSRRDAVKEVARALGLPAREVYRRVLPDRQ